MERRAARLPAGIRGNRETPLRVAEGFPIIQKFLACRSLPEKGRSKRGPGGSFNSPIP